MNKREYLNDEHVKSFTWMGQQLQTASRLGHGYVRPGSAPLHFVNLAAAFERYNREFSFLRTDGRRCAGRSFAENAAVLDELQQRPRDAVAAHDDAMACDARRWK